ncbi:MAG: trypsin-like peptidase domain-containing protein [Neobacillus sp.]
MIVKEKPLKTTIIHTDHPFELIKTVLNQDRGGTDRKVRRVIFTRHIGVSSDEKSHMDMLTQMDQDLRHLNTGYLRLEGGLYNRFSQSEIQMAEQTWNEYLKLESQIPFDPSQLYKMNLSYLIHENTLEWTKKTIFKEIVKVYDQNNPGKGSSARRNFGIKFLIWMSVYLKELFGKGFDISQVPKVIYDGDIKKHEQYFLLFLSKLGCDVLYINPKEDIKEILPQIHQRSVLLKQPYTTQGISKWSTIPVPAKKEVQVTLHAAEEKPIKKTSAEQIFTSRKVEKSYEELAELAKSVVLINVYNQQKELLGRGSGVVISEDGFILTNFHVISKGEVYGITFENSETEYFTNRLVKYHQNYDLALLKIDRRTEPLLINPQEKLVRGQKIVAIGSPLGLFNTISDGIISGFRDFGDIEVLQITAPISAGSSGGALIDLYGNLIGITTAGFDEGQNLNLAVGTKYIKLFAEAFLKKRA